MSAIAQQVRAQQMAHIDDAFSSSFKWRHEQSVTIIQRIPVINS